MVRPRIFAYIISTVGPGFRLIGSVPWIKEGKVFFGPCKKRMRPEIREEDYIMGLSPAGIGTERRVLLWMRVEKTMTFAQAYARGDSTRVFRLARGHAIHVRPKSGVEHIPGDPNSYEHIPGAPHSSDWETDIKGSRDVFISGADGSWVAGKEGPIVTAELVELLRAGITWRGTPTIQNPLTKNPRGKHALLIGDSARRIISWVREPDRRILSSSSRTTCQRECSCE